MKRGFRVLSCSQCIGHQLKKWLSTGDNDILVFTGWNHQHLELSMILEWSLYRESWKYVTIQLIEQTSHFTSLRTWYWTLESTLSVNRCAKCSIHYWVVYIFQVINKRWEELSCGLWRHNQSAPVRFTALWHVTFLLYVLPFPLVESPFGRQAFS